MVLRPPSSGPSSPCAMLRVSSRSLYLNVDIHSARIFATATRNTAHCRHPHRPRHSTPPTPCPDHPELYLESSMRITTRPLSRLRRCCAAAPCPSCLGRLRWWRCPRPPRGWSRRNPSACGTWMWANGIDISGDVDQAPGRYRRPRSATKRW